MMTERHSPRTFVEKMRLSAKPDLSLKILKNLEQVFLQAYETQTSPDWIYDLGGMDSQSAAFLLHCLGKGEVRISLHNGEGLEKWWAWLKANLIIAQL